MLRYSSILPPNIHPAWQEVERWYRHLSRPPRQAIALSHPTQLIIVTAGLSCSLVAMWEIIQKDVCLSRGRLARSRVAAEVSRASCTPAPRRGETGILAGTAG